MNIFNTTIVLVNLTYHLMIPSEKVKSIALVSGGSNGIGNSIAENLAAEGMTVINADIKLRVSNHPDIYCYPCDVRAGSQIDQLYTWIHKLFGAPRILVINAGVGIHEKLTEGDPEKWQQVIDTNVMGALRMIRAFVPDMFSIPQSHVILISSVSAYRPFPWGGVYSASKTALEIIAETLRLECGPKIKVTVISPGITNTGFFENELSGKRDISQPDVEGLRSSVIAEQVMHVLRSDHNTAINRIEARPVGQEF